MYRALPPQKRFKLKGKSYPYPSRYGSHRSMMIPGSEDADGTVTCKDEFGDYETHIDRLDSGLADSNRWDRPESRNF